MASVVFSVVASFSMTFSSESTLIIPLFVLQNNDGSQERKQYFGAIQRELADGGAAAMLYDLLQMPLGDWHPREVPVTPALMRQKKESLRGHHQWFEPLLQSGTLPTYCGRPDRILTEDLLAYVKATEGSNKEKVRG
jgi:hypothetical protein